MYKYTLLFLTLTQNGTHNMYLKRSVLHKNYKVSYFLTEACLDVLITLCKDVFIDVGYSKITYKITGKHSVCKKLKDSSKSSSK